MKLGLLAATTPPRGLLCRSLHGYLAMDKQDEPKHMRARVQVGGKEAKELDEHSDDRW